MNMYVNLVLSTDYDRPDRLSSIHRALLSSHREIHIVYEPIQMTFTLTNDRDEPIEGEFGLGFLYDQLSVFYRREGEGFHPYTSGRTEPCEYTYVTKIPIPAHGQISAEEVLLYDIRVGRFVFSEPGIYEFRARYRYVLNDYSKVMESNTLRVTVLASPPEEREVLTVWRDPKLARIVQGDWVYSEEAVKLNISRLA